ncbi:S1 RNA-binding domain-containing protein [Candidatus Poribacteria bacterium]|nr:S1 RNA-binding domain-containing protein [Candidatus Poribacteria bacterium]
MREKIKSTGKITSKVKKEWKEKESKYKIYYEFSELLKDSPSHRMLAISRGTNEDVLVWKIEVNDDEIIRFIESNIIRQNDFIFHEELKTAIQDSFMRLLFPSIEKYITHEFGIPTLTDILNELKKPGIDPRKEFASLEFSSEINEINDLKEGMTLSGTVTNVTNFGAFVDIGVHQDGLIHISKLANRFVKNPHDIVSVGDIVKIKVLSIDVPLKRISLEKI